MADINDTDPAQDAVDARSPRMRQILDEAREMMRESGWGSVSMRRLATRLGVKAPSLYKHISGKDELYRLLLTETLSGLADAIEEAQRREPTVASVLEAYRRQALADKHGYRLISRTKVVDVSDPDELDLRIRRPFFDVAGGEARGLALWAFAHGLIIAELVQHSDVDVNGIWAAGAEAFEAAAERD